MTRPSALALPIEHGEQPWLLAIVVATIAPHVENLPLWLSLLAAAAVAWRIRLWRHHGNLPGRWLLIGVVLAGVAAIAWQYRSLLGRDSGVALLVFFMALKPLEMRSRRDATVVVLLGLFLLLTHAFYSQSIFTGLWLLAVTILLVATLIRLHGGPQSPRVILRQAARLLAQATPLMLVLFLLFPRVSGPLWGLPRDAYSGLSGLSDRISPGSLDNLIQSAAIAFRVEFDGTPPDKSELYWRGPVFNDYDGRTWRALPTYLQLPGSAPLIEPGRERVRYEITLEPHNLRWLLPLDLPLEVPAEAFLSATLETLAREPVRLRVRHAFVSAPDYLVGRNESRRTLQSALRLPPGNPRSRELAAEWKARAADAGAIADAALEYFRSEDFFYTLQPDLLGNDAIDEFLFETRNGFCEHFASAFVFLMRAAGVPARLVAGYQGGDLNPVDGYWTVRQSDAHAWAEIWIAERGWVRIDPTAVVVPARIAQGIQAALPESDPLPALLRFDSDWLRDFRNRWEAANNLWNQWILGYNPQRQRMVLTRIGFREPDWQNMVVALAALCALVLFAFGFWTLRQRPSEPPELRLWRAFCQRLQRFGIHHVAWEGPLAFAQRIATERPDLGPLACEAASHYIELRYGLGRAECLPALESCLHRLTRHRPEGP